MTELEMCDEPHVGDESWAGDTERLVLERADLDVLMAALARRGFTVIGPTARDGAIVYDELSSTSDLPVGWTDEQDRGVYRLRRRTDDALFGYAVGPHSWKRFLHPPKLMLWRARRVGTGFDVVEQGDAHRRLALFGVRPCELRAIAAQDQVFLGGSHIDPHYAERRRDLFIVAVNCSEAGGNCFCASMESGPKAHEGFDISLTEVRRKGRHYFVVESGSRAGGQLCGELFDHEVLRDAAADECDAADALTVAAAESMGRSLDTVGIRELLYRNAEHPRVAQTAERCLTCGNCTMVCPTCFCTTVEDVTDLAGEHAERWRRWDSCFTLDFSYIHGGSVRNSARSRYRQWITHKLASWIDQFGTSGCVGCGRCITWCPAGIDITEEMRAIREAEHNA